MKNKIGIVGLGLIGASMLKDLSEFDIELFAVSKSQETLDKAKQYTQNVSLALETLQDCDIVFVCTPMNKVQEILDDLEYVLPEESIVCDVCSLKRFLLHKKRNYKFISTHPMAGTENNGFDNAVSGLFECAKWVMTPGEDTSTEDIAFVTKVIKTLGAKPVLTTPEEHDRAVALISHMPMVVAQALFKTAQSNDLALELASSGFRDMTRLALSNEEMASDMVELNADYIQEAVLGLYASIGELLKENYKQQISDIKYYRQDMYLDGKNIL